jgi:hypothetical protein
MSGAKQNAFMLSSATLMLAKFGETPVFDLTPADHSVGLAKEIAVVVDSSNIDLTAGIAQALVDSKKTNVQTSITGTVQEYSAENFLRAQGFATAARQPLRGKLKTAAAGGAVSLTIVDNPIPGDAASTIPAAAGSIKTGDTILIQHPTIPELVYPTRASADSTFASGDHTVAIASEFATPADMDFPVDSIVWIVTEMEAGSTDQGDLFSAKIVGTLANFNRPVVYLAPKVQITKGFNLSFTETEYGGMPWEMRGLLLSASEATGRLAEIGTRAAGRLYAA